jgi:hypothetical protein
LLEKSPGHKAFSVVKVVQKLSDLSSDKGWDLRNILLCKFVHKQCKQEEVACLGVNKEGLASTSEYAENTVCNHQPALRLSRRHQGLLTLIDPKRVFRNEDLCIMFLLND